MSSPLTQHWRPTYCDVNNVQVMSLYEIQQAALHPMKHKPICIHGSKVLEALSKGIACLKMQIYHSSFLTKYLIK